MKSWMSKNTKEHYYGIPSNDESMDIIGKISCIIILVFIVSGLIAYPRKKEVIELDEQNTQLVTICKQAVMKMESAMVDINEIKESELLTDSEKEVFNQMIEMNGNMMAVIVNMVAEKSGISEEDFMSEQITPEEVEEYPGTEDILNDSIE